MNEEKLVGLLKWLADKKDAALESIAVEDGKSPDERQVGRIISMRERYLILDEVCAIVDPEYDDDNWGYLHDSGADLDAVLGARKGKE